MTAPAPTVRFLDAGDAALFVEFGTTIDPVLNARVLALNAKLLAAKLPGLVETVPTYRSLMVQIDPLVFDREAFEHLVLSLLPTLDGFEMKGKRWRVPVVYGGEFGIDLEDVAARHKLTSNQIIERHAAAIYRVYCIGFMPGFTYLGGLDQSIATPRRLDPRAKTPAGTISIGGIQALVAGQEMPSGWHLLGRTPAKPFMATRTPVMLFEPGDEVVFQPIDASRWPKLVADADAGALIAEVIAA